MKFKHGQILFIAKWILANTGGGFFALLISGFVFSFISRQFPANTIPNEFFLPIYAFVIGIGGMGLGFFQSKSPLKGKVNPLQWTIASGLGAFVFTISGEVIFREFFFAMNNPQLSEGCRIDPGFCGAVPYTSVWLLIVLIYGVLLGVTVGGTQWLVLRRDYISSYVWMITVTIGGILTFSLFMVYWYIWKAEFPSALSWCFTSPILFSLLTGGALFRLLYKQKRMEID